MTADRNFWGPAVFHTSGVVLSLSYYSLATTSRWVFTAASTAARNNGSQNDGTQLGSCCTSDCHLHHPGTRVSSTLHCRMYKESWWTVPVRHECSGCCSRSSTRNDWTRGLCNGLYSGWALSTFQLRSISGHHRVMSAVLQQTDQLPSDERLPTLPRSSSGCVEKLSSVSWVKGRA